MAGIQILASFTLSSFKIAVKLPSIILNSSCRYFKLKAYQGWNKTVNNNDNNDTVKTVSLLTTESVLLSRMVSMT